MKNIKLISLLSIILFASINLNAQTLSCGFEIGSGLSYIIEDIQQGESTNFDPALAAGMHLKYTPEGAYFGLRLNVLHVSTTYTNIGIRNVEYTGEVLSNTVSILLEHLQENKKFNMGYNFGMGLTEEKFGPTSFSQFDERSFMSISVSGILAYKVSEHSNITLTPTLLWTDPLNTFRTENWYTGREDGSAYVQLGYVYRLK